MTMVSERVRAPNRMPETGTVLEGFNFEFQVVLRSWANARTPAYHIQEIDRLLAVVDNLSGRTLRITERLVGAIPPDSDLGAAS